MPNRYADPQNIFLKSRLRAAKIDSRFLNREYAARKIHCSSKSLIEYEAGYRLPQDTTVLRMAEAYQDTILVFEALEQTSYGKFLKIFLGLSISRDEIPEATLAYVKERNDLTDEMIRMLISAAVDGRYDDREHPVIDQITEESKHFINRAAIMVCLGSEYAKTKTAVAAAVCG